MPEQLERWLRSIVWLAFVIVAGLSERHPTRFFEVIGLGVMFGLYEIAAVLRDRL